MTHTKRFGLYAALCVVALLASGAIARAGSVKKDDPKEQPGTNQVRVVPAPELGIYPQPYPTLFTARVYADRERYQIGETVRISFRASEDAYVYLFNTDARGVTRQIFPNYYDRDNFVRGGRTYSIPDRTYRLVANGPRGRESLHLVAYRQRWQPLEYWDRFDRGDPFPSPRIGVEDMKRRVEGAIRQEAETKAKERKEENAKGRTEQNAQDGDRARFFEQDRGDGRNAERPGAEALRIEPRPPILPPYDPGYCEDFDYITISDPRYRTPEPYPPYYEPPDYERPYYDDSYYNSPIQSDETYFSISSNPSGADVYIDGMFRGKTPGQYRVKSGQHDVIVQEDNYNSAKYNLTVSPGRHKTVFATLQPIRR